MPKKPRDKITAEPNQAELTPKKQAPKKVPRDEKLFKNLLKVTSEFIKGKRYAPLSRLSLIERLNIHPDHLDIFDHVLKSLHEEGHIKVSKEMYLPHHEEEKPQGLVRGLLRVHPRGFGFVEVEEDKNAEIKQSKTKDKSQDIFIPKPYINGAVDGDIVEVLINLESMSEKGPEGKVITIAERKHKQLVGIIFQVMKEEALAYCSLLGDRSLASVEFSSSDKLEVGDRVVLEVLEWGNKKENTKTKLYKKIGHISEPLTDIPVAILENGIRDEFPIEAQKEAASFGTKVRTKDLEGREDLRDLECFTIDPDTAKDYDDAVSLIKEKNKYILSVHIADVSHYVKTGSALDIEARKRCNSTYFPSMCVPMLPFELSNNLCSLKEGVLRLTVSAIIEIDFQGNVIHSRIARSVIKSAKRFTYKQAKLVLDDKLKSKHKDTLLEMVEVCRLLKEKRKERGSVELYMPELVIKIDKDGVPTGTELVQYDITHQMVEEFMLLANETVAKSLAKQGKELTYRVHEVPAKENLRDFAVLAEAFGHKLSYDPTPQEIQKFFVAIEGTPFAQYLSTSYIRSMRLACYSADNIGHYGLSLEHYCHFTSPIRRYVDIIAHRLLFEAPQDKKTITDICTHASERERISARAENSVMNLKKLRLLDKLRKEQEFRQFEAVVTRVKHFGIYFDVLELMFEGFLHISELDNDYFIFDEKRMQLCGRHHQITYRASDPLIVMVKDIDFITQEVTWDLVSHPTMRVEKTKEKRKKFR